jgi:hypothetical protein
MPFADSPIRATRHRRPDRRAVGIAAAMVLALVAAGCGAAATPSPSVAPIATPVVTPAPTPTSAPAATSAPTATPVASEATTGHIVTDSGFAITLPDGWERIPVDPAQLQAFIAALPADSELRTLLEDQAGAFQGAVKFWAFDVRPEHTAGGFARNVNIIVQPAAGMSLSAIEGAAKAALESIGAVRKPVTSELVDLPGGPALRLDYILDVAGATGNVAVAGTQYYVQLPNATLIVSFSTDLASQDDAMKDFEAIADSIEAVP